MSAKPYKPKYQITDRTASISHGKKSYSFKAGSDEYKKAIASAKNGDWSWLLDPSPPTKFKVKGVRVHEGSLQILDPTTNDYSTPPVAWQELFKRYEDSDGVQALIPMWVSLRKSNEWIQTQVLNGLRRGRFAVRPNGNLVMFRGFRISDGNRLMSIHDGSTWTFGVKRTETYYDMSVRATCTAGLHAAPWDTVRGVYSSSTIAEVDIEPCDIVAIPTEDSYPKIRAKAMTPIRFCPNDPKYGMFAPPAMIEMKGSITVPAGVAKEANQTQGKIVMEGIPEKSGEFILDFTTDRVTIPFSQFELCGFVDKGTVKLYRTDPRARFMIVTKTTGVDTSFFRSCGVLKRHEWEWEYDASSNRSVSIRASSLANCSISGFERYKVETWIHNDHRYATIRAIK